MSTVQYLSFGMIKVGINDNYEVNWYLVLYYIVCILIAANLAGWLYNRGQVIGAVLTIALLLLIFIFFGLRWFNTSNQTTTSKCPDSDKKDIINGTSCDDKNTFPPSVNLCPDFMVAYTEPNGRVLCYDVNNTYDMKQATGGGLLTGLTINGVGGQSAYTSGIDLANAINATTSQLSSDPRAKYIKWEGVYDGNTVTTCRL